MAILRDLKVVSIVLEPEDDAQIIFETLNGRGARLHATDLIRNYVFMSADREGADSEGLYARLWSPFETEYWSVEQRRGRMKKPRLEWLIHTSLQAELHEEIDLGRLYFEYRRFASPAAGRLGAETQLQTLTTYAGHYKELVSGLGDTPLGRFGRRIAPYDITTLHPLALMIARAAVSDAAKSEMLGDLVSYLVRRTLCGLTPKNYNNVFLATLRQLHVAGINPQGLRTILNGLSGEASRWPTDAEFRKACLTGPLFPGRVDTPKMRAILTEIEAGLRAKTRTEEPVTPDLSLLDVDHILPRSWFTHWPLGDGSRVAATEAAELQFTGLSTGKMTERQRQIAARQASVLTLGNLTLLNLSVNREAQHFAFVNKRDLLIKNTSLRLNVPLVSMAAWDEPAIEARSIVLADVALHVWPGPRQ